MEDFNDVGPQKSFDVIPAGTICALQITVRPGNAGDGGWLTAANTTKGNSIGLDLELVVVDGEYAKRKVWIRLTLSGYVLGLVTVARRRRTPDRQRYLEKNAAGNSGIGSRSPA